MAENQIEKTTPKKKEKKYSITTEANQKGEHINHFLNAVRVLILPIFRIVKPFRFYGEKTFRF